MSSSSASPCASSSIPTAGAVSAMRHARGPSTRRQRHWRLTRPGRRTHQPPLRPRPTWPRTPLRPPAPAHRPRTRPPRLACQWGGCVVATRRHAARGPHTPTLPPERMCAQSWTPGGSTTRTGASPKPSPTAREAAQPGPIQEPPSDATRLPRTKHYERMDAVRSTTTEASVH